ncbi:hypothetical protein Q8F55_003414 [Vanrija albida]|uniref:GST N-terminal domain-containing protein n=1 Tax=Vanrija albida TaxID=181172 RepID=A0ABR3Q464_9TREE
MTVTPYVLYGLTGKKGSTVNGGPHTLKTKVDLAILGVPYTDVPQTFPQIRGELAEASGNPKVTVPTLKAGDEYVTDSWVIAEWLEAKHGSAERSLFYGPEGKAYAKFLETWANNDLANEIRPFAGPNGFANSDPDVQVWLVANKQGGDDTAVKAAVARLDDPEFVEKQTAAARAKLQTLEKHLAALKAEGKGPFVAGDKITHGDATIFGWYASSQGRPAIGAKIWRSDELPLVGAWVDAVIKATGINL